MSNVSRAGKLSAVDGPVKALELIRSRNHGAARIGRARSDAPSPVGDRVTRKASLAAALGAFFVVAACGASQETRPAPAASSTTPAAPPAPSALPSASTATGTAGPAA